MTAKCRVKRFAEISIAASASLVLTGLGPHYDNAALSASPATSTIGQRLREGNENESL